MALLRGARAPYLLVDDERELVRVEGRKICVVEPAWLSGGGVCVGQIVVEAGEIVAESVSVVRWHDTSLLEVRSNPTRPGVSEAVRPSSSGSSCTTDPDSTVRPCGTALASDNFPSKVYL